MVSSQFSSREEKGKPANALALWTLLILVNRRALCLFTENHKKSRFSSHHIHGRGG